MEPRLEVAHALLRRSGVIFVSNDDRENAELKLLMLVEADQSTHKGKDEIGKKAGKVLEWVSNKGVDVLIAVLPYLAQLV